MTKIRSTDNDNTEKLIRTREWYGNVDLTMYAIWDLQFWVVASLILLV